MNRSLPRLHPSHGDGVSSHDCAEPCVATARSVPTILANCQVVDPESGTSQSADVMVRGGVVESVQQCCSAPREMDGVVLDLHGAWLVPGLIDAHAHLTAALAGPPTPQQLGARLDAYLEAGVTTIRDAGARDFSVLALGRATRSPRVIASGRAIRHSTPALAVAATQANVQAGARWIKAYELEPAELSAVLGVARSSGLRVGAHLGNEPARSLDVGLEAVEHVYTLIRHDLVPHELRAAALVPTADQSVATWFLSDPDAVWIAPWYESVGAKRPFVTSTLLVMSALKGGRALVEREPRETPPWASEGLWERWRDRIDGWGWWALGPNSSPEVRGLAFGNICRTVRHLADAGARICAGTDFGEPVVQPGLGVFEEMRLLRAAGLSDLEVLRTATSHPADLLGLRGKLGTLAVGAWADAVAVTGNPFESWEALTAPICVMAGGDIVVYRLSELRCERSTGVSTGAIRVRDHFVEFPNQPLRCSGARLPNFGQ